LNGFLNTFDHFALNRSNRYILKLQYRL